MTTLRDIRHTNDFKKATHQLHDELKNTPAPSLNQLQSMLAKAIGARSLEAFYAQASAQKPSIQKTNNSGMGFPKKPYVITTVVKGHLAVWCAPVGVGSPKDVMLEQFNYFLHSTADGPVCVHNRDAVFTVMSESNAHRLSAECEFPVQVMPLEHVSKVLCDLLCSAYAAPETFGHEIRKHNALNELDCTSFWFNADNWREEVDANDTSRGYVDWVLSQLEMWRYDMTEWMF